jgi:hypothetical protein
MTMYKRLVFTLIIVIIGELLWMSFSNMTWDAGSYTREHRKYQIGFPFHSISFVEAKVSGKNYPYQHLPEMNEWQPGFSINWLYFILDCIILAILSFLVFLITRFKYFSSVLFGLIVGFFVGITEKLIPYSHQGGFLWLETCIDLSLLPFFLYLFYLRNNSFIALCLSVSTAGFIVVQSSRWINMFKEEPISHGGSIIENIVALIAFISVILLICLLIKLIHKKVLAKLLPAR